MKRRILLQSGAAMLAWPGMLLAQSTKRFRVGLLAVSNEATAKLPVEAFLAGLADRGYRQGSNLVLDVRYADGDLARLPILAGELLALKPDVLAGVAPAAIAMRSKTTTIPIVLLASADPVADGLVQSLARPGTNVTGLSNRFDQLIEKHIELLSEIAPKMSRVALLYYGPTSLEAAARYERLAKRAATAKGLTLVAAIARDEESLRQAFIRLEAERPGGIVVLSTAPAQQLRHVIIGHARRLRLPSITALPGGAESGWLVSYGADALANYRYAASFVDRILKGAKPAEMPVEQLGRFELVVNLKAAHEIGITIPRSILGRADRVIE
jgi:putative ABC transport system substrate-binding protein